MVTETFIEITGKSIIGFARGSASGNTFFAFNPETGKPVEPNFHSATADELDRAAWLADTARIPYGNLPGKTRAVFLRTVADNIEALGDALIQESIVRNGIAESEICRGTRTERAGSLGCSPIFSTKDRGLMLASITRSRIDNPCRNRTSVQCFGRSGLSRFFARATSRSHIRLPAATLHRLSPQAAPLSSSHTSRIRGPRSSLDRPVMEAAIATGMPEGVFSLIFAKDYELGPRRW
jgi:NADP-dependent aldehyde dehydrogenase